MGSPCPRLWEVGRGQEGRGRASPSWGQMPSFRREMQTAGWFQLIPPTPALEDREQVLGIYISGG